MAKSKPKARIPKPVRVVVVSNSELQEANRKSNESMLVRGMKGYKR